MSAIDFALFRERFMWKKLLDFMKRSESLVDLNIRLKDCGNTDSSCLVWDSIQT